MRPIVFALMTAVLLACSPRITATEVTPPPPARTIPAEAVPQLLDADADLRLFRQYVFDDANAAADRFFPAYNRWLDAFASAIRYDTSPPGRDDPLVTAANADLQPYRTIPQTHDLETVAAIQQRTSLDFLAATLSQLFRGQPAQTRAAAADYLLRRYRIMLGRSESQ